MAGRNAGNKCIVKSCTKMFINGHVSFFRFPKDPERCNKWVIACDYLEELATKTPEQLYKSYYRVCGIHFEEKMFLNDLKNRLQPHAVPSLYLDCGENSGALAIQNPTREESSVQMKMQSSTENIRRKQKLTMSDIQYEAPHRKDIIEEIQGTYEPVSVEVCISPDDLWGTSNMTGRKAGNKCIVKNCTKTSVDGQVSFFRFPKDPERCNKWVRACDCLEELATKTPEQLYKSYYRVCGIHFEEKMFLNDLKNRLQPHAFPSLHLGGESSEGIRRKRKPIMSEVAYEEPHKKHIIKEIQGTYEPVSVEICTTAEKGVVVNIEPALKTAIAVQTSPLQFSPHLVSPLSTQTTMKRSKHTPQKEKLRRRVRILQSKTTYLQKKELLRKVQNQTILEELFRSRLNR